MWPKWRAKHITLTDRATQLTRTRTAAVSLRLLRWTSSTTVVKDGYHKGQTHKGAGEL